MTRRELPYWWKGGCFTTTMIILGIFLCEVKNIIFMWKGACEVRLNIHEVRLKWTLKWTSQSRGRGYPHTSQEWGRLGVSRWRVRHGSGAQGDQMGGQAGWGQIGVGARLGDQVGDGHDGSGARLGCQGVGWGGSGGHKGARGWGQMEAGPDWSWVWDQTGVGAKWGQGQSQMWVGG